jgi:hypothetical protein
VVSGQNRSTRRAALRYGTGAETAPLEGLCHGIPVRVIDGQVQSRRSDFTGQGLLIWWQAYCCAVRFGGVLRDGRLFS